MKNGKGGTAIGGEDFNSKVMTSPSSSSSSDGLNDGPMELIAFWSSFLLLHLGGPDTITAFALEDNELWKRHLFGLITQVGLALYVITKSVIMKSGRLNQLLIPTVLVFLVGVLKFGERTWTLRYGSQDKLRESMENIEVESEDDVEAANNTISSTTSSVVDESKILKLYHMFQRLLVGVLKFWERMWMLSHDKLREFMEDIEGESEDYVEAANNTTNNSTTNIVVDESEILPAAHNLYLTFRRLIMDQILTSHDQNKSKPFFMKLTAKQAFRVIEIELSLIYEALYTKAPLVYTIPGVCFRALAFTFITISFIFFQFITDKSRYQDIDLAITYVLLEKRYWSHNMAQYNMLQYYKPHYVKKKMIQWIDLMKEFYQTRNVAVTEELKEFIFKELKRKLIDGQDKKKAVGKVDSPSSSRDYKRLSDCRGERVLQECGYLHDLGWSVVDIEFDESIIIWHLATEFCYNQNSQLPNEGKISLTLSKYMLYLLIFRTPMITTGIRKPYKALFGSMVGESLKNTAWEDFEKTVVFEIYGESTPIEEKVSKPLLRKSRELAEELNKIERTKKWKMVSAVWTEMLCYAASHCRGYNHAQRLSKGGELLTFVWFLMAHFGIGQHYRVEAGHAII
ncbi:hypothetical protein QJS04_geneDACA018214 [Acorus gramineus]|uniref:DUF4220 domain-containing protein n=1 Tax=Acorus gramineus TaxID=55184 RepID=A0AAV9BVP0_ACOGR|nr:hypothetical protein QJS04_geneDACA018214 [Acorus gramineus]